MSDNRILLGKHPTHGYGLFVSRDGVNVASADNDYFLFDSTSNSISTHAQLLLWKEVTCTASSPSNTITFNTFGRRCFVQTSLSWPHSASATASDISCISESSGTVRTTARWGNLGSVSNTVGNGDDVSFKTVVTYSGSGSTQTGLITVTRLQAGETDAGRDICVQCLVFKEQGN